MTAGDFCGARFTAAESATFLQKPGTRGTMDCTVYATSTQKTAIGGIYDRVDVERSDIRADHFNHHIRNTPKRVSSIGAFRQARKLSASTSRVFSGGITPSSHNRAEA